MEHDRTTTVVERIQDVQDDEPADAAFEADTEGPLVLPGDDNAPSGETSYYLGVFYRGMFIPKFYQHLFIDGGSNFYVNGGGVEFTIDQEEFVYNIAAWFADYGFSGVPYKSSDDSNRAWDLVDSKMKAVYVTGEFLWVSSLANTLGLTYGFSAGLGGIFGELKQTQAYLPTGADENDPNAYKRCPGVTDAPQYNGYCSDPKQDLDTPVRSWADGGSKPLVFPWVSVQAGLRWKPTPALATHVDVGIGTGAIYFGAGVDYGL